MNKRYGALLLVAVVAVMVSLAIGTNLPGRVFAMKPEFLVFGQTSGGTGGGGGGGQTGTGGSTTLIRVIPQIAVGDLEGSGRYSTTVQIINSGTAAVTVQGEFFKQDGTASAINLRTNMTSVPPFAGTLNSVSLPPNGILILTADTDRTFAIAWGRITTTAAVTVSTVFEIRDPSSSALVSRVGVTPSAPDMAKFVIPRIRNVQTGFDVGFALVNAGSTSATIAATLVGSSGQTLGSRNLTLAARNHTAQFAREFFTLPNEPSDTSYSFVVFESTAAQFAAIALAFEGPTQTSFPVDRIR